jgi:tetratricopeptide (TPR) repeat protein
MSRFDHLEMDRASLPWPDDDRGKDQVDYHYFLDKASIAFSEGNYERALTLYSRSLEFDISLEEAWLGQIRCLIELHELQEAVIWSDRALEHLPNNAQILAARAVTSLRMNDPGTAAQYSDAATASKSVTAYVWIARGEVLLVRNAINSKACFMKAVEIAPTAETHTSIARAYMAHDGYHEALTFFRNALRINPELYICWYWMGCCLERLGEIGEAMTAYHRSAAANPSFVPSRDAKRRLESGGLIWRIGQKAKRLFHHR